MVRQGGVSQGLDGSIGVGLENRCLYRVGDELFHEGRRTTPYIAFSQ